MIKRTLSILMSMVLLLSAVCGCTNTGVKDSSSGDTSSSGRAPDTSQTEISSTDAVVSEKTDSDEEIEYIYVDGEEETEKISVSPLTSKMFTTLPAEHTSLLRKNPDRGFRSEELWKVSDDTEELKNTTYNNVLTKVKTGLAANAHMETVTVSRVYFYMINWREVKVLPDEVINYLDMILKAYKEVGVKPYLCIYYQQGTGYESYGAEKEVLLSHIEQYAALWKKYKDSIYAYDMTLMGSYGEWTAIRPALTDSDKAEIVNKVLELLPDSIYLLMRRPEQKATYIPKNTKRYLMTGFAQDAFFGKLYPYLDYGQGTWRPADDNEWWQMSIKESPYTINDGELFTTRYFNDNSGYVDGYTSIEAMLELHTTTFSINHAYGDIATFGGNINETVMYGWKGEEITEALLKKAGALVTPTYFTGTDGSSTVRNCFEYIRDYLGYHISATELKVTGGSGKGEKINLSLKLKNYGFGAAFNLISGFAVLDENNNVISEIESGDPSTWYSTDPENFSDRTQLTHTLTAQMKLPDKAGTYKLAFFLRNRSGQTARLDNTVEYSNGYNILHMFTID